MFSHVEAAVQKAVQIHKFEPPGFYIYTRHQASSRCLGDILVFLTGQDDINTAVMICKRLLLNSDVLVLPLHGLLAPEEKQRVL